jgi:hypothetical protein
MPTDEWIDEGIAEAMKLLTPVQRKMLAVLADGDYHARDELRACQPAGLEGNAASVNMHVSNIRKLIGPLCYDLYCRPAVPKGQQGGGKKMCYKLVRLLCPPRTQL